MPGLFHNLGHFSLVFGAGTGLPAGADLPFVGDVFSNQIYILVIEIERLVGAEGTHFRCREISSAASFSFVPWIITHE